MGSTPNSSIMEDEIETLLRLEPGEYTKVENVLAIIRNHELRNKDELTIEVCDNGDGLLVAKKVD